MKSNLTRISKHNAAKKLGLNETTLGTLLQQKALPELGLAYKNKSGSWSYLIYEEAVDAFIKKQSAVL